MLCAVMWSCTFQFSYCTAYKVGCPMRSMQLLLQLLQLLTFCNWCQLLYSTKCHLVLLKSATVLYYFFMIWPCNGIYAIRRYSAKWCICCGAAMAQCSIIWKATSILPAVLQSAMCSTIRTQKLCPKLVPHAVHADNKCNIEHAVASCKHMLDGFMCSYLQWLLILCSPMSTLSMWSYICFRECNLGVQFTHRISPRY